MTDTKNTEVLPAPEPPVSVQAPAPVTVVREKSGWVTPLIAALVVVVTLVVGGVGGFALAAATHAGGRPAIEQGQFPGPGGPQQGPQQSGPRPGGPLQGPGGQHGDRPNLPPDDATDDSTEDDESTPDEGSTEG
ncbi:MAG TPA: hypothetical protein VNS80_01720 [Pseudolysinimonas sp.]|nr:hypothetical protein [Pseudolysinimonas sp.]